MVSHGEHERMNEQGNPTPARRSLDGGQFAHVGALAVELEPDFLPGFTHCGIEGAGVRGVHSPTWEGHVSRPGVTGILRPLDQENLYVFALAQNAEYGAVKTAQGVLVTGRIPIKTVKQLEVERCRSLAKREIRISISCSNFYQKQS